MISIVKGPVERFIRKSCLSAAVCNLALNPALAWLGDREMTEHPLCPSILIDTGMTCLAMSLLIALFVSADVGRALRSGAIGTAEPPPRHPGWLSRLPARPWRLGVALGGILALVILPCLAIVFGALGISSLSFASFALFKAVWTPVAAWIVARWAILRRLSIAAA